MKHLKTLSILTLLLVMFSCNKDDGDNGTDPTATFNATINGGTFTNYGSTLGFYDADSTNNNLTIAVTDANNNIVRIFMNSTGGLGSGVIKEINNVDVNNFTTTVTIRDQGAMVTYTSISGSISILENRQSVEDSDYRLISGSFNITASTNTGTTVTMTGNFENMEYLQ